MLKLGAYLELVNAAMPLTIQQLNHLDLHEFTRLIGPIFEHSPWIAESTWPERPFASVEQLHHGFLMWNLEAFSSRVAKFLFEQVLREDLDSKGDKVLVGSRKQTR